jgi:hypothetical protein
MLAAAMGEVTDEEDVHALVQFASASVWYLGGIATNAYILLFFLPILSDVMSHQEPLIADKAPLGAIAFFSGRYR